MLNALIRDEQLGESPTRRSSDTVLLCQAHSTGEFKQRHLLAKEEETLFDSGRESMRRFMEGSTARGKS